MSVRHVRLCTQCGGRFHPEGAHYPDTKAESVKSKLTPQEAQQATWMHLKAHPLNEDQQTWPDVSFPISADTTTRLRKLGHTK